MVKFRVAKAMAPDGFTWYCNHPKEGLWPSVDDLLSDLYVKYGKENIEISTMVFDNDDKLLEDYICVYIRTNVLEKVENFKVLN